MTELQAYKLYVLSSQCEWQTDTNGNEHLAIWLDPDLLRGFAEMIPAKFDDGGVECMLCSDGSVYVPYFDCILEEYDIDPENIVPK